MERPAPVIDTDGHVMEHRVDWAARLPARFRKEAPCWATLPDGDWVYIVERKVWPTRTEYYGHGGLGEHPGGLGKPLQPHKPPHQWTDREGMWDPAKRLEDMDFEGIDIAVLLGTFVSQGTASIEDPELAAAVAEAYNDWLAEYCAHAPDRLKGLALMPLQDPKAARRELRRAVRERGMIGAYVFPHIHGHLLHEPQFDEIWEEAQALDVPVCIHFNVSKAPGTERFDRFVFKHAYAPFAVMMAVGSFVAGGILERFPTLRVAFLEGGVGWVPWLMDRLHEHWELLPQQLPWQKRDPREVMRSQQCYYAVEVDETTIPYVAGVLGEERLLYSSDYAHWDCVCPDSVKTIVERGDLSDRVKRRLLGENAVELFRGAGLRSAEPPRPRR
jgi:uncharacterized protein